MPRENLNQLIDQFARTISYLRLSITDRCNLRCLYCTPPNQDSRKHTKTGIELHHSDLLSYEELHRFVRLTTTMGMNKIRLTGGEPLVRKGVLEFVQSIFQIKGLDEVRLTTNGVLLHEHAQDLFEAGVRHINVSLDTLEPKRFHQITGRDCFNEVWQGIVLAKTLGFSLKVNVVAMKGINDDEFANFAQLACDEGVTVRFIEYMPVGKSCGWSREQFISAAEIQERIQGLGDFIPHRPFGENGPARMFRLTMPSGKVGTVGFISPLSHHFCDTCNRLRLTSDGKLRSCLLNDRETDIRQLMRTGASDTEISDAIRTAVLEKPSGHDLHNQLYGADRIGCSGQMSRIGG